MSTSILSIALALAVAFGVFLIFQGLSRPQTDLLETRLAQFGDHDLSLAEMELALPFAERFLRPILDRMGNFMTSRTPANRTEALALRRYKQGAVSYLEVVIAQTAEKVSGMTPIPSETSSNCSTPAENVPPGSRVPLSGAT